MKNTIVLVLISLTFFGCTEGISWDNLDKAYLYEVEPENFKTRKLEELIQLPQAKELDTKVIKDRLKKSTFKEKRCVWKGGSFYGIAVFTEGEVIKLKLSSNYGIYQDVNSGKCYSIEGYEKLGSMKWEELLKD